MCLRFMKRPIVFFISFLFIQHFSIAQKEGHIWYFGENAGIDFSSGSPVAITDGALVTGEGCSSICDSTGTLLFYTNGVDIWNRNHNIMHNGSGLGGSFSSSQSAIILKKPGSNNVYFVFAVQELSFTGGLTYSEIDMNLQGGLGGVTSNKNVPVVSPSCEKLTAIQHANGSDYWILTHGFNSNEFHSYLLDSNGFNMTPVVSSIGLDITAGYETIGFIKASLDGTKIASTNYALNELELFDFDNSNGILSNLMTFSAFNVSFFDIYDVAFSPKGNMLYVTQVGQSNLIYQFDLNAGSHTNIANSREIVGYNSSTGGAMQLGPDNRIYFSDGPSKVLGVINNPNLPGINCNYDSYGFSLAGKKCEAGLPGFHNRIFGDLPMFASTYLCEADSALFSLQFSNPYDSVQWNFGDPMSGAHNVSIDIMPKHRFSDTGVYYVRLITFFGGSPDTTILPVNIRPLPNFTLGNDTVMCYGDTLILDATTPGGAYLWQDDSDNPYFIVTSPGTYSTEVLVNHCSAKRKIKVSFILPPSVNLGPDTNLCIGDTLIIDATSSNASYLWQDGSTDSILNTPISGLFWVEVTRYACKGKDSIVVTSSAYPKLDLGNDTILCKGDLLSLDITTPNAIYLWQNQSTNSNFVITLPALYWAKLSLLNCSTIDSIEVDYSSRKAIKLGIDTTLCLGDTIKFNITDFDENTFIRWQDSSSSQSYQISGEGYYSLYVKYEDCESFDDFVVTEQDCEIQLELPNIITPNNDGKNDVFTPVFIKGIHVLKTLIYNQWGIQVFETDDLMINWNPEGHTDGTYYWFIQYTDIRGANKSYKGTVTLAR